MLKRAATPRSSLKRPASSAGLFLTASAMSFKENDKELIRWYLNEVAKEGIDVRLNTKSRT